MLHLAMLAGHIGGGLAAIGSGWIAVTARKGGRLHRRAGTVFLVAMLLMATLATVMAVQLQQFNNIGAGILALYLVGTAWMAARRPDATIGWFEYLALLVAIAIAGTFLRWGVIASSRPHGLFGYAPVLFYVFGSIAALLAVLDLKTILAGGLAGPARIARHLWRMCLAFFLASGSFFLGQQKVMPKAWHGSTVLLVLGLAPLAVLIFWMIRVRLFRQARQPVTLAAGT